MEKFCNFGGRALPGALGISNRFTRLETSRHTRPPRGLYGETHTESRPHNTHKTRTRHNEFYF